MAFAIKQHDLRPNLYFQIFQPDKTTPQPLDEDTVQAVFFVMRNKGGLPKSIRGECTISNAAQGVGYYDWVTGDTDTPGAMQYEFEIVWANGDPQTVPVDTYLTLTIYEDLG